VTTIGYMDDLRIGAIARAVRHRLGLRQLDVALKAGVSQRTVSSIELGRFDHAAIYTVRAVLGAVGIRLVLDARWQGGEAEAILDRAHAELIEACARVLRQYGWHVMAEQTFSRYGERGSIDLLAWHAATRSLLVIEVKTRILDIQGTLAGLDRKGRLAASTVRSREWIPTNIGRVLVASDINANRSKVGLHAATFDSVLPARSREVRAWVHRPVGSLAGVWFLALSRRASGKRHSVMARRVRVAASRSVRAPVEAVPRANGE
jgi:Holliday junction resolvase-like predicted endonuclease